MAKSHSLRRGQLISTYGPGAVIDIGDESFVVCGTELWKEIELKPCPLPRLQHDRRIGGLRLLTPKEPGSARTPRPALSIFRFPRWMFCQRCRLMKHWNSVDEERHRESKNDIPLCQCGGTLVPMRFVQMCANGHLDDVDWPYWAHRSENAVDGPQQCHRKNLKFIAESKGGSGLASLKVKCQDCDASKSLDLLMRPGATRLKCRPENANHGGKQPWQRSEGHRCCESDLVVCQRGDSNLHYAKTVSALDIPEAAERDEHAEQIASLAEHAAIIAIRAMSNLQQRNSLMQQFASSRDIAVEIVQAAVAGQVPNSPNATNQSGSDEAIRTAEYPQLINPTSETHSNFSGSSYKPETAHFGVALASLIKSVSQINKLREVRVFRGFHRVNPGTDERLVDPNCSHDASTWLPAYEVYGEGIFIAFDYDNIQQWIDSLCKEESIRCRELHQRIQENGLDFLPKPDPGLVMLHGFSHALIRRLCFECGYSASSLRERVYYHHEIKAAGILIYTADGDSEGTLGGLVRQGDPERLPIVLKRALHDLSWCSADPICIETGGQGLAGLNKAACHSCLLVSETSCEWANVLLDRRYIIGNLADGSTPAMQGYFHDVLEEEGLS